MSVHDKNYYQRMIHKYKERREVYRERFNYNFRNKNLPFERDAYNILVANINYKIGNWNKAIRRIEVVENKLETINQYMIDFLGISVKRTIKNNNPEYILARKLFCKYCLENKINGRYVRIFLGAEGKWTISKLRLSFTRSFEFNSENKQMWLRFKNYVQQSQIKIAA